MTRTAEWLIPVGLGVGSALIGFLGGFGVSERLTADEMTRLEEARFFPVSNPMCPGIERDSE